MPRWGLHEAGRGETTQGRAKVEPAQFSSSELIPRPDKTTPNALTYLLTAAKDEWNVNAYN